METRAKVIRLKTKDVCVQQTVKHLEYEGVNVSSVSFYALLKKYETTTSIQDRKQRSRPQLLGEHCYRFIDDTVVNNMDKTSRQLHSAFISKYVPKMNLISISTVKWVSKKTQYCALISETNQEK